MWWKTCRSRPPSPAIRSLRFQDPTTDSPDRSSSAPFAVGPSPAASTAASRPIRLTGRCLDRCYHGRKASSIAAGRPPSRAPGSVGPTYWQARSVQVIAPFLRRQQMLQSSLQHLLAAEAGGAANSAATPVHITAPNRTTVTNLIYFLMVDLLCTGMMTPFPANGAVVGRGCAPAAEHPTKPLIQSGKKRLVGARGFEPPTTCTPSKCATRLRHAPTRRNRAPRGNAEPSTRRHLRRGRPCYRTGVRASSEGPFLRRSSRCDTLSRLGQVPKQPLRVAFHPLRDRPQIPPLRRCQRPEHFLDGRVDAVEWTARRVDFLDDTLEGIGSPTRLRFLRHGLGHGR